MANPQDRSASSSPRPMREKKLPGHLVDYEHNLTEPPKPSRAPSSSSSSDYEEDERWQRMESVWSSVLQHMTQLQVSMEETRGTLLQRVERLEQASKPGSPLPPETGALQQPQHISSITEVAPLQPSSEVLHDTTEPLTVPVIPSEQGTTTPANMPTPVETSAPSPPRKVSLHTQPVLHPATYVAASTPLRRPGRCTAEPFSYQRSEHQLLINRPGQVQLLHPAAPADQPLQHAHLSVHQLSQAVDPVSVRQTSHPAAPVFQARHPANPVYLEQPPRPADPTNLHVHQNL